MKKSRKLHKISRWHFIATYLLIHVIDIFIAIQVSSTLKIPTISGISKTDDLTNGDNLDSLEDLNKEIEKLCPFNNTNFLHPNDIKFANSRFCDIFSRQSMESDDNDNSSPDDEDRIDFLAIPQQSGCDILQLVPKKPVVTTAHTMYQPCTNSIVQLKQSSFSAFNSLRELSTNPTATDGGDEACGGYDDAASTSQTLSANREIEED